MRYKFYFSYIIKTATILFNAFLLAYLEMLLIGLAFGQKLQEIISYNFLFFFFIINIMIIIILKKSNFAERNYVLITKIFVFTFLIYVLCVTIFKVLSETYHFNASNDLFVIFISLISLVLGLSIYIVLTINKLKIK
jgi:hypothetical protein